MPPILTYTDISCYYEREFLCTYLSAGLTFRWEESNRESLKVGVPATKHNPELTLNSAVLIHIIYSLELINSKTEALKMMTVAQTWEIRPITCPLNHSVWLTEGLRLKMRRTAPSIHMSERRNMIN
jgi:hypothetical protein